MTFINLPSLHLRQPDAQVPLGILYVASCTPDSRVKNYATCSHEQAIEDLDRDDFYGITATSLQLPQANRFAKDIKRKFRASKIILGGPATVTPEFVDWDSIDSIIVGDGEQITSKVITDSFLDRVYRPHPVDVDSLPFPARHLVDNQGGNIFGKNENYFPGGSAQIITSRGCNHKCAFCAAPKINNCMRFRNIDNVVAEIKDIIDKYGIRQFRIADDNFTVNRRRVFEFCEKVAPLNIVFRISARVKPCDVELLTALKLAGMKEISFGIESFDPHVLKTLNKESTVQDNITALESCAKVGIKNRMLFMIGTPGQTEKTVDINIRAIESVPFDVVACTHFVPMPGSDIYENPARYEIEIFDYNLENYNFYSYDSTGRRMPKNVFGIKGRDLKDVNAENERFIDFLESTGKLNQG